jgi:hypothetical protein
MTNKYGPWIAFNEGDTPPADDVMVQVQLDRYTRERASTLPHEEAKTSIGPDIIPLTLWSQTTASFNSPCGVSW